MGMRKDQFRICPNNQAVWCANKTDNGCEKCGWNPCVAEERKQAIRKALMPEEMNEEDARA